MTAGTTKARPEENSMSQSQFQLLRDRRFLPLFLAQFLAAFNDNVFKNALVILMTYKAGEKTGVDPRLLVTAAAGIFILPFFLFSATAGQIADKFEKSRLIRLIRLSEVPVMLLAAGGFFMGNYWVLLGALFCAGVMAAFFGPLKYSILPEHLREDELIGGNALVEAGTFVAILLGTILGGVLILREGGVTAVSAIIVAVAVLGWLSSRWVPEARAGSPDLKVGGNFIVETFRLVRRSTKETDVFLSIMGISWFWLVGFTFLAQFPVYVRNILGADEQVVTLFLTVFSVGVALGSMICNKLLKGNVSGIHVPMGIAGMTAGIFLFWAASPSPAPARHDVLIGLSQFIGSGPGWGILASLFVTAAFGGLYIVPLYAIMQTRSEPARRSRTVAVNNIMNALFMVLGAVGAMILLKMHVRVTDIFLMIGILNIPVAFLTRRLLKARRATPDAR
jgi:acyl-[acyl-carrier-protein]-phospholipid O-acyltransferase/long-chain-fatty-acid--[acyl-carrier-protein] ligase